MHGFARTLGTNPLRESSLELSPSARRDEPARGSGASRCAGCGSQCARDARCCGHCGATGLAQLLCDRNRRDEARELLAPLHAWFREGHATADHVAARVLLDSLG